MSCTAENPLYQPVKLHPPDLVLMDLMLLDNDGLSILRGIRTFSKMPVIIISANADVSERVLGLDMGS